MWLWSLKHVKKKHIERNLNEYTHRDIEFSIIEFSPNLGFIGLYCKL